MNKKLRRPILMGIVVVLLLGVFGFAGHPATRTGQNHIYRLRAPSFLAVARAQEIPITSVIEDEGGISAYFQAATPINMTSVRDAFRTIEDEGAEYLVGSVAVENYPESEDVHVYVHADGWILAYYLAADPAAKIFDWRDYYDSGHTLLTTKLENTLIKVANYAVVAYPGGTYYDFRNPNSTHLMLIADWVLGTTDSFEVNLPGTFTFDERSWSFGTNDWGRYKLDGVIIAEMNCNGWCTAQGIFELSQLLPNQFHTIEVWAEGYDHGYAGLALVYWGP